METIKRVPVQAYVYVTEDGEEFNSVYGVRDHLRELILREHMRTIVYCLQSIGLGDNFSVYEIESFVKGMYSDREALEALRGLVGSIDKYIDELDELDDYVAGEEDGTGKDNPE